MNNYLDVETISNKIDKAVVRNESINPTASIIIVTYNSNISLFEQTIKSLTDNTTNSYEILIIDNSEKSHLQDSFTDTKVNYIKLKRNYGLTIGRNIGISYSKGKILIFLDDDAIPGENFIDEHIKAHQVNNISALRGKCLPRTKSIFNHFASHYDLGNDTIPYIVNLEGNSSFNKNILIDVGGFSTALEGAGGHEGLEISKRIIAKTMNPNSIIYCPKAIIYHDYSKSLFHFLKKEIRHRNHWKYISKDHSDLIEFYQSYSHNIPRSYRDLDFLTKTKIVLIRALCRLVLRSHTHFQTFRGYNKRLKSNN
ncbi:MAG: hypothetical protein A3J42_02020 [Candidatus Dadabacteria bacterium RIFCSPHIGHO2_12_FULL_53_21]|nr:MAG: hypothetical protein A3J42_02020 [Candidatus Dadabacteria bacterium RIFCSPHIGHO2_12_FULL_53_21]